MAQRLQYAKTGGGRLPVRRVVRLGGCKAIGNPAHAAQPVRGLRQRYLHMPASAHLLLAHQRCSGLFGLGQAVTSIGASRAMGSATALAASRRRFMGVLPECAACP